MTRSRRGLLCDAAKRAAEVVAEILEGGLCCGRLHIHHDVEPPVVESERRALAPVRFPRPALESIANVGFPDLLRRGDPDSRMGELVDHVEEYCVAGKKFSARLVDSKVLTAFCESLRFRQRFRTAGVCLLFHRTRARLRRRDAYGLCGDGVRALPDHLSSASGRGSRACAYGGGCLADRCASCSNPLKRK